MEIFLLLIRVICMSWLCPVVNYFDKFIDSLSKKMNGTTKLANLEKLFKIFAAQNLMSFVNLITIGYKIDDSHMLIYCTLHIFF